MTHIVCKVCGTDLDPASAARCSRCETLHHPECMDYGQGCSVYGCDPKETDRLDKPKKQDGPRKNEWLIPPNALGEFSSLYMGLPMLVEMLVVPIMNCSSPAVTERIQEKVEQQLKAQRNKATSPVGSASPSQTSRDVEFLRQSPLPQTSPANDADGFDQDGYDSQGFDRQDTDRDGHSREWHQKQRTPVCFPRGKGEPAKK